jgi:hypothetical protein
MSTLLQPHRHSPAALIAGWLPRGFVSTAPIRDVVDTFVGADWPGRFWAVAADYGTGRASRSPRGRAARERRRRRRGVLRDPRLLPPGGDRGTALRRRRDLLGVEPRHALRRGGATS